MDISSRATRPLSKVLLKITLLLTLALGMLAALTQLAMDLQQEKHAVEASAEAFLDSTVPSAETAVYNFYDAAAKQAVTGLFTQRAIRKVQIFNGDELMIERERVLEATLPSFAPMSSADEAELVRELFDPETDTPEVLMRYARSHDANLDRWAFLTGDAPAMREVIVEGLRMRMGERGSDGDILHGGHFVLIDPAGRIRGFYRNEGPEQERLERDARRLSEES